MATRSCYKTKTVIAVFLFVAGIFLNIEAITLVNEASAQSLPTGCASSGASFNSSSGFTATDFDMLDVYVNSNGYIELDVGASILDTSNIVIPFDQDVSTVFLLEGAGFVSDFGWFTVGAAYDNGDPLTGSLDLAGLWSSRTNQINWLFRHIEDDQETGGCCTGGDGILDAIYNDSGAELWRGSSGSLTEAQLTGWGFQTNQDGVVDPRDMRKYMGFLAGGTEIVYFLRAMSGSANKGIFYSKDGWSSDVWSPGYTSPGGGSIGWATYARDKAGRNAGPFTLNLNMDDCAPDTGACPDATFVPSADSNCPTTDITANPITPGSYLTTVCTSGEQGMLAEPVIGRMGNPSGTAMQPDGTPIPAGGYFNTVLTGILANTYTYNTIYNHFILAAPPSDPFKWIISVEDYPNVGDADFNDLVILLERKNGGSTQLKSVNALSPPDANAYITSATIDVTDNMPCSGSTSIRYYVSVDNGTNWSEITDWTVWTDSSKTSQVTNWVFGAPAVTYREATVNFTELGLTGRNLVWKSELITESQVCVPQIQQFNMAYTAAVNAQFSRSAPVVMTNMVFNGSFETPAASWPSDERGLRGHFKAQRLYDPTAPSSSFNALDIWDGGAVLTSATPSTRNYLIPEIAGSIPVTGELLGTGDGTTTAFSGTLASSPIAHSTISITDGIEIFTDKLNVTLEGSLTGTGTINRFTGEYTLVFNTAPSNGSQILAGYTPYTLTGSTVAFSTSTNGDLALDNSQITDSQGTRYIYDFNADLSFTSADGTWLTNWVTGYKDGAATKKAWVLSAIDHSAPAIVGAPGIPAWYYGSEITDYMRDSFDQFRCNQRTRDTVAYVGDRMGQVHAFKAGKWRPYYVDESLMAASLISSGGTMCGGTGAFADNPANQSGLTAFRDAINPGGTVYTTPSSAVITTKRGYFEWPNATGPDYGDGSEIWSITPTDQLAKFKNNKLQGSDHAAVDASPAVAHMQFADNTWHTVLIFAEGNGGDHITALDITDENADPVFLWDFADPDLFRSRSSPSVGVIGRVIAGGVAKWVVFFVSGVNNDASAYPKIYMVDIESDGAGNPANVLEIPLDSESGGIGGTPSGQPGLVDSDGNGVADRMYIGTDKGYMYKITLPDSLTAVSGTIDDCVLRATDLLQPIQASPAAVVKTSIDQSGELKYSVIVLFGTGDSPYQNDNPADQYYFYAVEDTAKKGVCVAGADKWAPFALPVGQRVFASAFATAETVFFGTSAAETDDPCAPNTAASTSSGMIFAINIDTGVQAFSQEVGNIVSTPVVDDEHLYIKTADGQLMGFGGDNFQNDVKEGGIGSASIKVWRQID